MKKFVLIVTVVVIVVVGGFGIYAWIVSRKAAKSAEPVATTDTTSQPSSPTPSASGDTNAPAQQAPTTPTNEPVTGKALVQSVGKIAAAFVERLGTYSSDAQFSNVTALYALMTPQYRSASEAMVAKGSVGPKMVVTTRAISTDASQADDTHMRAVVTTQRERTQDGVSTSVYQKATVELVNMDGEWKVDSVTWGNENAL